MFHPSVGADQLVSQEAAVMGASSLLAGSSAQPKDVEEALLSLYRKVTRATGEDNREAPIPQSRLAYRRNGLMELHNRTG